jgi:hypothetical protein
VFGKSITGPYSLQQLTKQLLLNSYPGKIDEQEEQASVACN